MVLTLLVIAVLVAGVIWSRKNFSEEKTSEKDRADQPSGLVEFNIQFPQDSYKAGERVFGENTGSYRMKPLQEDIKGVFLLSYSRPDLKKAIYGRRINYTYPVKGERRRYIKEEVRQSVSEEEFQKRLNGHLSGTLRAFLMNDSKTRAYVGSFKDPGEYTYTISFFSCQDITEKLNSSCFQPNSKKIKEKVEPTDQVSKTITVEK